MKVIPRRKPKDIRSDEIRVIHVNSAAVEELLWENLMAHQAEYFETAEIDDSTICTMYYDRKQGDLVYTILPISYLQSDKRLNYDHIRKIGFTANTLFQPHRYKRLRVTPEIFVR